MIVTGMLMPAGIPQAVKTAVIKASYMPTPAGKNEIKPAKLATA
jgi:hypothetical protein